MPANHFTHMPNTGTNIHKWCYIEETSKWMKEKRVRIMMILWADRERASEEGPVQSVKKRTGCCVFSHTGPLCCERVHFGSTWALHPTGMCYRCSVCKGRVCSEEKAGSGQGGVTPHIQPGSPSLNIDIKLLKKKDRDRCVQDPSCGCAALSERVRLYIHQLLFAACLCRL